MIRFKTIGIGLASVSIATLGAFAPIVASAQTTNSSTTPSVGIFLGADNLIHVFGATVTGVSSSVIDATTAFGSNVMNWVVNIGANTQLNVNGTNATSTADISTGDKIAFSGTATTSGATTTVAATRVIDPSYSGEFTHIFGKIATIGTNALSVITKSGTTTVNTDADTSIRVGTTTGASLADLSTGAFVSIAGFIQADGSTLARSIVQQVVPNWPTPTTTPSVGTSTKPSINWGGHGHGDDDMDDSVSATSTSSNGHESEGNNSEKAHGEHDHGLHLGWSIGLGNLFHHSHGNDSDD